MNAMRAVLDNNQLTPLPAPPESPFAGVTLAPLVFAEILLRKDPGNALDSLRDYDLLFGKEHAVVATEIAGLEESEIRSYRPYIAPDSTIQAEYAAALFAPQPKHIETARAIKAGNRSFCQRLADTAIEFRKTVLDVKSSGKFGGKSRFTDITEALAEAPSFHRSLIIMYVTNGGVRSIATASESLLVESVLANPNLDRLFRSIFAFVVSVSRGWTDQTWNYDPSGKRDDWTDVILPLYADDGDVILTADGRFRRHVAIIDPSGRVRALPVADIIAELNPSN